jgi:hypothetical protein
MQPTPIRLVWALPLAAGRFLLDQVEPVGPSGTGWTKWNREREEKKLGTEPMSSAGSQSDKTAPETMSGRI